MKKILIVLALVAFMASPALADEPFQGTFIVYCYSIDANDDVGIVLDILTCNNQSFIVPVTVASALIKDALLHQLNSYVPQPLGFGSFLVDLGQLPAGFEVKLMAAKWGACAACPTP